MAWGLVILVLILRGVLPAVSTSEPSEAQEAQESALVDVVMKLQGRMMLAVKQLSEMQKTPMPQDEILALEMGSVEQRQQVAVLAGVLFGAQGASDSLQRLQEAVAEADHSLTQEQEKTNAAIKEAFSELKSVDEKDDAPAASTLSDTQRELLLKQLGWFGELAIARTQPGEQATWSAFQQKAMTLLIILMGAFVGIAILGLLGMAGLLVGLILSIRGRLSSLKASGAPGLFIETFAVWLVSFLVLSEVIGLLGLGLGGSIIVFFLSLVALAWLPFRGMPFSTARSEIGLTMGRGLFREVGSGVAGFVMMIPILLVGVIFTVFLVKLSQLFNSPSEVFHSDAGAAHPIFSMFEQASTIQLVVVFVVASIAAPIVEEIVFRGLLYRHLRDSSRGVRTWLSIAFAALLSGFVFAAIHPQGWVAIPALGSIGVALALAREWRSSLIAPMVMHGIQNGLVLTFVLFLID